MSVFWVRNIQYEEAELPAQDHTQERNLQNPRKWTFSKDLLVQLYAWGEPGRPQRNTGQGWQALVCEERATFGVGEQIWCGFSMFCWCRYSCPADVYRLGNTDNLRVRNRLIQTLGRRGRRLGLSKHERDSVTPGGNEKPRGSGQNQLESLFWNTNQSLTQAPSPYSGPGAPEEGKENRPILRVVAVWRPQPFSLEVGKGPM